MTRSQIAYAINTGTANLKKHAAASTATIITNTACIVLLSIVFIIGANVRINLGAYQSKNTFLAFVDDRLSQSEAIRLQSAISSISGVWQSTFITKEEAYEQFVSDNTQLSQTYLDPSILRDRYAIRVQGSTSLQEVAEKVRAIDGIADVRLDDTVTNGLAAMETGIAIIGTALTIMLLAICIIIMTNTINLTTLARQEEIQVMKMMGAYDSFTALPFVCEGFITGLSGALLAFLLSSISYSVVATVLNNSSAISLLIVLPYFELAPNLFVISLLYGVCTGLVGSLLSVRRYLRRTI